MIKFLKPDFIYNADVTAIRLEDLKSLKVEALFIDLDNTVMAPKSARLDPPVRIWLDLMKMHFNIVILTNNKKKHYLNACEHVLGLPVIGYAKKPWYAGAKDAEKIVNLPSEKIAVIGDRPLTDIWLAKRQGYKSFLVRALTAHIEPRWKFFLRKIEWSFISHI